MTPPVVRLRTLGVPGASLPKLDHDLRSTFTSIALASGLTVFETARTGGTSMKMIEAHYRTLIDTGTTRSWRLEGVGG